jgi:hypothetical protein
MSGLFTILFLEAPPLGTGEFVARRLGIISEEDIRALLIIRTPLFIYFV